jgi:hypothetical protein
MAKDMGILFCRLSEETSETRSDDGTQTPNDRHNGECSWLKFPLRYQLSNHCSDDTD